MERLRKIALVSALGLAVLTTPAFAMEPAEQLALAAQTLASYESREPAKQDARHTPTRSRPHRHRQPQGPFHPLDGKPDYGTAENAFGAARSGHVHEGHDVFAPAGTPLVAVSDGIVAEAGSDGGQGNYLYLYDPKADLTYVYMHMIAPAKVKTGEKVEAGQPVGGLGCTGSCWGDHLHFEMRAGKGIEGEAQDPLPLLERWDRAS